MLGKSVVRVVDLTVKTFQNNLFKPNTHTRTRPQKPGFCDACCMAWTNGAWATCHSTNVHVVLNLVHTYGYSSHAYTAVLKVNRSKMIP
jgi:hypothetical protein